MSVATVGLSGGATVRGSGGRPPPPLAGFTVIRTSALEDRCPSLALRRRTYWPSVENVAVVDATFAFVNVTVPGPLTLLQAMVRVEPGGSPSSVAVPLSIAVFGS